ncbi:MAG: hypothetical protein Q4G07_06965 [Oscillospiraceae bacterium]|nr:hypothetical protein [Oscillospiraceae bacterium]
MRINDKYKIIKRESETLLTDIEEGDVYKINDVTLAIFEMCEYIDDMNELIESIYTKFETSTDNYSKCDLERFVLDLMENKFITND